MTFTQSILFGAIQGVTEFLPVSSSGHLVVMRLLFGLQGMPILFEVLLHGSTLLVICLVFRARIKEMIVSLYRFLVRKNAESDSENLKIFLLIIYTTVVTAAIGLSISFVLDRILERPRIVSILFITTGLVLIATYYTRGTKDYFKATILDAVIVGFAQGLGVFPGISRSGITISVSLVRDVDRKRAGEFSFLISIPAIIGAFLLKIREAGDLFTQVKPVVFAVGFAVSFVVGLLSLLLLLNIVRRGRLYLFSIYLIPVGILTFFLF